MGAITSAGPDGIPYGARFRLKASFDPTRSWYVPAATVSVRFHRTENPSAGTFASGAPFLMAIAIMMLELFVAFLQAFIFSLLAAVFIGQIREAHH